MISDPEHITWARVDDCKPKLPQWLPIRPTSHNAPYSYSSIAPEFLAPAKMLRALSQTCRRLREFCLPLLWRIVHVRTVAELGRLSKVLQVSPSVASLIRSFCFLWDMANEAPGTACYQLPASSGSLLDLAFVNRFAAWEDWAHGHGLKPRVDEKNILYVVFQGDVIYAPGRYESYHAREDKDGNPWWDPYEDRYGCIGPDGLGEDGIINSPQEFNDCIVEVVARLSSLETFGWMTSVAPLPFKAFASLRKLTTLSSLHYTFSRGRGNVHFREYL